MSDSNEPKALTSFCDNVHSCRLLGTKDMPLAIYELDLSTFKFKWTNQYLSYLLGYSETELLELKATDLLCDNSKEIFDANIKKALTSKQTYFISEVEVKTKNGSSLWGIFTSKVIFANGKPSSVLVFAQDITERKKIENALRLSEEKFAKAFLNSPFAVTLTRLSDGRVLEANQAALCLFGYSLKEVIGRESLMFWADQKDRLKFISEISLNGSIHYREIVFVKKDGSHFQVSLSSSVITFQGEKYLLTTFIDVTESKKAEELLKSNEKLYRAVFDNSQDAFQLFEIIYNENDKPIDERTLKVNQAFENLTGIKAKDVVGKTVKELAPNVASSWFEIHDKVIKKGKDIHLEYYHDFEKRYYDAHYFPYSEKVVGLLFRDITNRKTAETALLELKIKYEELIDKLPEMVFELSDKGQVTFANLRVLEIMGYSAEELRKGFDANRFVAPEDVERSRKNMKKSFSGQMRHSNEYQFVKKDGTKFPVLLTSSPIVKENLVVGARGVAVDLSERKEIDRRLKESERLAAIGATAGMVGHDIRNPLQAITGELYLLNSSLIDMPDNDQKREMKESIDSISANISYINKIVADLQDYARMLIPEYSIIDLPDLIEGAMEAIIVPDNIKLSVGTKDMRAIKSDATYLRRSIINLANNAIQAMPDGGNLEVACFSKDDRVFVNISDTGVGIPDEIKNRLFTPMVTTKAKGQGLGLAVVKRLIEALNGTVRFESEAGKGTKFTIELPITQ